ncbi:MAG: TerC family protein [Flammeovirgaceae bacterium]
MEVLFSTEGLISLLTLAALEIILGIDNVIFISIITEKLPEHQEKKGRVLGLMIALGVRVLLLLGLTTLLEYGLKPLFTLFEQEISIRDLILILGGLFLLGKSTAEIHSSVESGELEDQESKSISLPRAIVQIVLIDIVFSFDSILTAVGLVEHVLIMVVAVVISMVVMIAFSGIISDFIEKHPTFKMLALAFLVLVGFLLMLEGLDQHVPKGYVYFAIAFSFAVELLNMRVRKKKKVIQTK